MEREKLDRILADEEELVPSSGFLASVMERVETEAVAPAPIPFPWKRMIPGFVLALSVLVWAAVEMAQSLHLGGGLALPMTHLPTAAMQGLAQVGWVALALALAWGASMLARRLAGREEML